MPPGITDTSTAYPLQSEKCRNFQRLSLQRYHMELLFVVLVSSIIVTIEFLIAITFTVSSLSVPIALSLAARN